MKNNIQKAYVLTCEEYNILLAASGIKKCFLLDTGKRDIDSNRICNAMMHLYSTGIIDSDGTSFSMQGELKNMIEDIKSSDLAILIRMKNERDRVLCCYKSINHNGYVVNEVSEYDDNAYRIYRQSGEELRKIISDAASINRNTITLLDEDEMYEAACNIKKELTSDEFSSYVNLQLAVDYMSLVEGAAQKRLLVLYQDNIKRLVVTDSDQVDEEEFSEISLKEKLNDIG